MAVEIAQVRVEDLFVLLLRVIQVDDENLPVHQRIAQAIFHLVHILRELLLLFEVGGLPQIELLALLILLLLDHLLQVVDSDVRLFRAQNEWYPVVFVGLLDRLHQFCRLRDLFEEEEFLLFVVLLLL